MGAVLGHEAAIDDHIVGAGGAEPHDLPGVFDPVVALRHEEGAHVGRLAVEAGNEGAEEGPVAVLGAAGEAPATAEHVAALYPLHLADRHVGGGDEDLVAGAPDLVLRLLVEEGELPLVNADNAEHPGRRGAVLGNRHLHVEEDLRVVLKAAPDLWLQNAEEASLVEGRDVLLGQLPDLVGGGGAGAELGAHGVGTSNELFVAGDVGGRRTARKVGGFHLHRSSRRGFGRDCRPN